MPFKRARRSRPRKVYRRKAPAKLAPKTALAVKKIVKSQMSKVIEHKNLDYATEPLPALCYYHNVPYVHDSDMCYSQQGITDSELLTAQNRIGDSIFVKNIQLRLMITNFQTRPNLCYRITIIKVKNGNTSLPGGSIIYGHPQSTNMMLSPIDTELEGLQAVVYDRTFNNLAYQTAQDGNEDKKFLWSYNIKVNRKIRYDNSSSSSSSPTYRLLVTCYDSQNVLITDNVARFSYFRRTHFLDA
jgi:hypothetical protein